MGTVSICLLVAALITGAAAVVGANMRIKKLERDKRRLMNVIEILAQELKTVTRIGYEDTSDALLQRKQNIDIAIDLVRRVES